MHGRIGKLWLLAAALPALALTACNESVDNVGKCDASVCVNGNSLACVDGVYGALAACVAGSYCVDGSGCIALPQECVAADYPKCDGQNYLTCTDGKPVISLCLAGEKCVVGVGCEADPDKKCTETDASCRDGKLMTCTNGAWVKTDCAIDEVCSVNACVPKSVCSGSETDCKNGSLLTCTNGAWVTSFCNDGEVCKGKACAPFVPCTGTETSCEGGKLQTCANGLWVASDCGVGEVCLVKSCVPKVACTGTETDCMGDTLMVCTNGDWVTSKCPTGEVCFGKVCAPEVFCTGSEKKCSDGKLMTCTNNAWVTTECTIDQVCAVDACVPKPVCTGTETDCMGDMLMVCTNGDWVTSKCPTGEVCFGKVCAPEVVCTGSEKKCSDGKLMTCTNNAWVTTECAASEVCTVDACVLKATCTGSEKACSGNKLQTCTDGVWVSSDCASDQDCVVDACVTKPACVESEFICKDGKLQTCVQAAWVASDCAADEICVVDACVKDLPVSAINPEVVACKKLSISGPNTCEKTGSGVRTVLRGDILTRGKTYKGGSVVVANGRITYVGCEPDMTDAVVVTCPGAVVSAGLINGHDHITFSNNAPAKWGDERFDHRHDWRIPKNGHKKISASSSSVNEVPELRSLMSGTTGIFGSGSVAGLVRNLDKESVGGVKFPVYQTFPLGDTAGTTYESGCSKYAYKNDDRSDCAYGPHIAEGINMAAYNELVCLSTSSGGGHNVFNNRLAIIHGIAATPVMIGDMATKKIKLIWSPRTNIALYGDTAQAPLFDRLGVTVGLGTDWVYSGSANMLRELACVDYLNTHHYNHYFNDYQIWLMATYNNAFALGLESVLGDIKVGLIADISVFKVSATKKNHRAVIEAQNKDVSLVMLNGKLVFGDANIVTGCETADVCGSSKGLCLNLTGTTMTYASINGAKKYDLFFCGTPGGEPTCVPQRTRKIDTKDQNTTLYSGDYTAIDDRDGDGILDAVDNCPDHFNPIRPQDIARKQSDVDGDRIGDICDVYPLCANNDATCN